MSAYAWLIDTWEAKLIIGLLIANAIVWCAVFVVSQLMLMRLMRNPPKAPPVPPMPTVHIKPLTDYLRELK